MRLRFVRWCGLGVIAQEIGCKHSNNATLRNDMYRVALCAHDGRDEMNAKQSKRPAALPQVPKRRRPGRIVAARSLAPERPTRVWSLLLPPTFPAERK